MNFLPKILRSDFFSKLKLNGELMNKLISMMVLSLSSFSALANAAIGSIPEPETLTMFGIGALAFIISRKVKK